jgi:hypothetical protein
MFLHLIDVSLKSVRKCVNIIWESDMLYVNMACSSTGVAELSFLFVHVCQPDKVLKYAMCKVCKL